MGEWKKKDVEKQVKKHLLKIRQLDGGWEAMLDILWRRGIIKNLKMVRLSQGLTQAEVAERMGVTQGRVAEIENELWPDPYIGTLASYAHALGAELVIDAVPLPKEPEAASKEPVACPFPDCVYTEDACPGHAGCPVKGCAYAMPHEHTSSAASFLPEGECHNRTCRREHDERGWHK